MPLLKLERREFCRQACQVVSTVAAASVLQGCSDDPTSPSPAPSSPGGMAPLPSPNPTPPPTPPPPPPGPPAPSPPTGPVSQLPLVAGTIVNGALVVAVDAPSPLFSVGGAALLQIFVGAIQRNFLLARTAPEVFSALDAVCTHEGCIVSRFASPIFVCPCHGSRYDTNGQVVQGPAPAALPQFRTEYADGVVTVRL